MYVVYENEKGKVKGYMRFFLEKDQQGNVIARIDTVDGLAVNLIDEMKSHIRGLMDSVGSNIQIRDSRASNGAKLGGALFQSYFHHIENLKVQESKNSEEVVDWKPLLGWPVSNPAMNAFHQNALPEKSRLSKVMNEELTPGGIDLTDDRFNMEIEQDKSQISQELDLEAFDNIVFDGLYIKNIEINPINNLPELLGVR
jgi:hypothetical protein